MIRVEKMPANLTGTLDACDSFVIRGLHEHVAYIGHADRVLALQNEAIALTPISLALDCRVDFRDRLSAGLTGAMNGGILRLGNLTVDTRQARTVDLALRPAADPEHVRALIPEWRVIVRTVMVDTLAERAIGQAGYPREGSRPNSSHVAQPEILGVGDLMLGLRDRHPLPYPARIHEGIDIRGAFIRQLNRFLEHAAALDALDPDSCAAAAEALARDLAGLVGLGPGLTPSGDDFLVGLLAVLGFLHDGLVHARSGFPADAFLHHLRTAVRLRLSSTTLISAAFLREAIHGRFNENLCGHIDSIAHGDRDKSRRQLAIVARAGHSSGTDTLGGMLLGMALATGHSRPAATTSRQSPPVAVTPQ